MRSNPTRSALSLEGLLLLSKAMREDPGARALPIANSAKLAELAELADNCGRGRFLLNATDAILGLMQTYPPKLASSLSI